MTDIQTETAKATADFKKAVAAVDTEVAKVKAFWSDYRLYITCALCLIVGLVLGAKVHL